MFLCKAIIFNLFSHEICKINLSLIYCEKIKFYENLLNYLKNTLNINYQKINFARFVLILAAKRKIKIMYDK